MTPSELLDNMAYRIRRIFNLTDTVNGGTPYRLSKDLQRYTKTRRYIEKNFLQNTGYDITTVPRELMLRLLDEYRTKRTNTPLSFSTIQYLLYCVALFNKQLVLTRLETYAFLDGVQARRNLATRTTASAAADAAVVGGGSIQATTTVDTVESTVQPRATTMLRAIEIDQRTEALCRQMILDYAELLWSLYNDITNKVVSINSVIQDSDTRIGYCTACAVLLCVATNLRSSELLQINQTMLNQMLEKSLVPIRIKKRTKSLRLLCNVQLLAQYRDCFELAIMLNYERRRQAVRSQLVAAAAPRHQVPIVDIAKATLNRRICRDFNRLSGQEDNNFVGGIQLIRKINTTNLIASSGLTLAQVMNRHKNRRTTLDHYNTQNYTAAQVNNVFKPRNRITPAQV